MGGALFNIIVPLFYVLQSNKEECENCPTIRFKINSMLGRLQRLSFTMMDHRSPGINASVQVVLFSVSETLGSRCATSAMESERSRESDRLGVSVAVAVVDEKISSR